MSRHVLVVDDDPVMRGAVGDYLAQQGFRVSAVADGRDMSRVLADDVVDLMVLDLNLADEDGLQLLRGVQGESQIPVIIVTGQRRDEVDRIIGLELGADDYVLKPFALRELLARVRAVLRRWEAAAQRAERSDKHTRYRFAGWELSLKTRKLTAPDGKSVPLTVGEFNLLIVFLRAPQHVLSREQILAASRVHDEEVFDRAIDVQILRLRRKLEPNPSAPELIRTERGAGYVFATSVEVL
jgi:two-component system, OmpR family, response regulator